MSNQRKTRNHQSLLWVLIFVVAFAFMPVWMESSHAQAASKKIAAPKKVKVVTDHKGKAASGVRVFVKYKKVKGATGYQIKATVTYYPNSEEDKGVQKIKKNTKKTKKMISQGLGYKQVKVKVRAYKIVNDKKVYGKWSKVKTKKSNF